MPPLPDSATLTNLCRAKNPARDIVLSRVDAATGGEIAECLQFLRAWQETCNRGRRNAAPSGEHRVRRHTRPRPVMHDNPDRMCIVRMYFASHDVTVEVPCWERKLTSWRSNPLLRCEDVLVEKVLYRNYRSRELMTPDEVLWLLGSSTESMVEKILLRGVAAPVGGDSPRAPPCWDDAIISQKQGIKTRLPWQEFLRGLPDGADDESAQQQQLKQRQRVVSTPPPVACRADSAPLHIPTRPHSAPMRPSSALSSSYAVTRPASPACW